jgi:hypothetical protein
MRVNIREAVQISPLKGDHIEYHSFMGMLSSQRPILVAVPSRTANVRPIYHRNRIPLICDPQFRSLDQERRLVITRGNMQKINYPADDPEQDKVGIPNYRNRYPNRSG